MAISARFIQQLQVDDTLTLALDLVANPTVTHQFGTDGRISGTLTSSSTVPGTKVWGDTRTLIAGADSLDLTALTDAIGAALTLNGLKVQLVMIQAAVANTQPVVFAKGVTTGYFLFGDTNGSLTLGPGASALIYNAEGLPDVGSGAKSVAVSSTMLTASYSILLVAG